MKPENAEASLAPKDATLGLLGGAHAALNPINPKP